MYNASVTRKNPALVVLLLDQSGSMEQTALIDGQPVRKADQVARVLNSFLSEIVNRCRREEGVHDYFRIVAIGYAGDEIYPLLAHDYTPVAPSVLDATPREVRHHLCERRLANGNTVVGRFEETLWIAPRAGGKTPMKAAMAKAAGIVKRWCERPEHGDCYPPVVMNVTDGEASDAGPGDLEKTAARIRAAATGDGNALLLNIHITAAEGVAGVVFPCSSEELPEAAGAQLLYELSSPMPEAYNEAIRQLRGWDGPGSANGAAFRGVSYNTPLTELIAMMNIGSVSVNLIE